ncbi:cyanophycinase [Clostridium sp. D2Q-11]|uniref:Cyanophycinase n=1 Tax=Anaeromonas frigoriresistens TaxID=2683708 RepID=A0A942Z9I5_9FIRM|nr:cyanophycinase [Anaeromonas frigoriresistens]MBS4539169.1 cyanophycinase [Anaeromonas frigoriresistens]
MKKFISILLITIMILSMTSFGFSDNEKGSLVIIGGALDPENEAIYNKMIELAGDKNDIKIAIIPAASSTPSKSGGLYKGDFVDLYNVPKENVKVFPIAINDDSSTEDIDESTWDKNGFNEELAQEMLNYDLVFFTGGNQLDIVKVLVQEDGTDGPVLESIKEIYDNGGVLAGSSAGAAIMTDPMIGAGSSFGALTQGTTDTDNYDDPDDNRVFLTKGLGFLENSITDQHFLARGRFGRLITALIDREINMGYGIDENTALVLTGDELEVIGESGVMIIDTAGATYKNYGSRLSANDIRLHYLETGDKYNKKTQEFTINSDKETTLGYEYYSGNELNTNIFGENSVIPTITKDLVDNTEKESMGLSFDTDGNGVKLIFNQKEDTQGYWGKIDGRESYAATNVYLDILPIKVQIKEMKPPKEAKEKKIEKTNNKVK